MLVEQKPMKHKRNEGTKPYEKQWCQAVGKRNGLNERNRLF